ncbi:hypothetical protein OIU78_022580 [Salix suchowensis]|nr:hypothetical protein OIU78_022580 [Salix suchowensis]
MFSATLKNKSNGAPLKYKSNGAPFKNQYGFNFFDKKALLNFGRNSTKLSWINRIQFPTKARLEESLQGVEELELNVKVRGLSDARKCWVEKCGVHFIMEKDKAEKYSMRASTPDDQRMQSILIRELLEGKIVGYKLLPTVFFDHFDKNNS